MVLHVPLLSALISHCTPLEAVKTIFAPGVVLTPMPNVPLFGAGWTGGSLIPEDWDEVPVDWGEVPVGWEEVPVG